MTSLEFGNPDNASRLTSAIDDMFAVGAARRGGIVREHEESLALIPTSPFSHCPTASRVYLERPIPEEADEAAAKWSTFGGHRVTVFENGGRIQTDFLVNNGEVLKRQIISYPGDDEPLPGETVDSQLLRRSEELLGEAIPQQEVDELLGWLNTAIPEQQ